MKRKQMTLYVDTSRCMNCRACEVVCKMEHDLPAGPRYNMVVEIEVTRQGVDKCEFLPTPCMHCGDAPCIKSCPTGAIYKRPEDGVVLVDQGKCIGCRECLWACPFGVPQFGSSGLMEKCDLCQHLLEEGEVTACARACPAEAITVGTVEEISAKVRERYGKTSRQKYADGTQF
ncbi:MAG TPA: 4Fe-4S dicluster domain-containing protein [Syntrophomonadaceae bacterium]|nr:4Fe-4S dicluster domain-containing protein [Syntrophomonadaceae bacterium]